MKKFKIDVASGRRTMPIDIGRQYEHEVTEFTFVYSKWVRQFGEGQIMIVLQRCGDANPYPVTVQEEPNAVKWLVTSTDTEKVGKGELQITYTVDGAVKKSVVFPIRVKKSLTGQSQTPPDPYVSWLEQVISVGSEVKQNAKNAHDDAESAHLSEANAKEYANEAHEAVINTFTFTEEDGEVVIGMITEV